MNTEYYKAAGICLHIKSGRIGVKNVIIINKISYARNFKDAFSTDFLKEIENGNGVKCFIGERHLKKYNYKIVDMLNDREFLKNVLIQIFSREQFKYQQVIINEMESVNRLELKFLRKNQNQITEIKNN